MQIRPQRLHHASKNTAIATTATLQVHFERASAPLFFDSGRRRPDSEACPAAAACSGEFQNPDVRQLGPPSSPLAFRYRLNYFQTSSTPAQLMFY